MVILHDGQLRFIHLCINTLNKIFSMSHAATLKCRQATNPLPNTSERRPWSFIRLESSSKTIRDKV